MIKLVSFSAACIVGLQLVGLGLVSAETYPTRRITMVVPFAPGGLSDVPMRILAPDLQARLGVPIVIENKPGGSGVLGATSVLRATPDGYTILVNAISDIQNLHYLRVPYSAVEDFDQIGMVTDGPPLVLVVNVNSPYQSLKDIVEDSKKPGVKVSFATSGPATSPAIAVMQLNALAGTKIEPVPYRGTSPAAAAILGGEVQGGFLYYASAKQMADSGQARAIGIATAKRFHGWASLPTFVELGYPEILHSGFVGLSAPRNTPPEIVATLNQALNEAVHSPAFRLRMEELGMSVPDQITPDGLKNYMRDETAIQAELAKQFGK